MNIRGKWLKKSVLAALCILLGFGTGNRTVSAETTPPIGVHADMNVEWYITRKDTRYEGRLNVSAYCIMERTYGKGKQREGPAADAVAMYLPQTMCIRYTYDEKEFYIGTIHPGGCKSRLRKKVTGNFSSEEPQGGSLSINRMSSMTDALAKNISPKGKEFASQLLQMYQNTPDSLSLTIKGPAEARMSEKLEGFRLKQVKKGVCKAESYEKTVPLFAIGLHLDLPESGSVQGSHDWYTEGKSVPTYFSASFSNIGGMIKEKPATGGSGVNYTISWNIGEDVNQPWEDPDDDCEKISNKIKWVNKVLETYKDETLRDWARKFHGDGRKGMSEYQKEVEREVSEAFPDTKGNPAGIHSEFQTNPNCTTYDCGAGENAPVIGGIIDGESFPIMEFDSDGDLVSADDDLMNYFRGQNDGFDGIMDHEKQHVDDLTSMGYPKSIDEWAEFEIRGFKQELEHYKRQLMEKDCEPVF
ncbi:MAG: hypothetical protein PHO98_10345 [Synergistaceae bacterium]|nr:hypothetical protein [Synergistaceae bacterium]